MARPKEFDRDKVLDRATRLFWERGFGGTSISDLEAAMGIGRTSIYAAFGAKEDLFMAAIDHYDATYSIKLRNALTSGLPVRQAIVLYFDELMRRFPIRTCRSAASSPTSRSKATAARRGWAGASPPRSPGPKTRSTAC